jgi:hypothetical protein
LLDFSLINPTLKGLSAWFLSLTGAPSSLMFYKKTLHFGEARTKKLRQIVDGRISSQNSQVRTYFQSLHTHEYFSFFSIMYGFLSVLDNRWVRPHKSIILTRSLNLKFRSKRNAISKLEHT